MLGKFRIAGIYEKLTLLRVIRQELEQHKALEDALYKDKELEKEGARGILEILQEEIQKIGVMNMRRPAYVQGLIECCYSKHAETDIEEIRVNWGALQELAYIYSLLDPSHLLKFHEAIERQIQQLRARGEKP